MKLWMQLNNFSTRIDITNNNVNIYHNDLHIKTLEMSDGVEDLIFNFCKLYLV